MLVSNTGTLAEMESYYYTNADNYRFVIDETASYLSGADGATATLVDGQVERMELATSISSRIAEYRDMTTVYNEALARFRRMDAGFMTTFYFPTPSEDLNFIVIGD